MTVVHAMLGNAAVAALLAVMALVVRCVCRSPAVRHAAWVIVLLKLVTPPLFSIPLPVLPASWSAGPEEEPPTEQFVLLLPSTPDPARSTTTFASADAGLGGFRPAVTRWRVTEWAIAVWVAGAGVWFVWQGRRIIRFRRWVSRAQEAPSELRAAVERLAGVLGITHPPVVKVATGIGSPMLWGWGREAVVLFPRDLLARLSADARDTLLAHELAHFLRRDHWVRVLEFVATGLYWWHPVVWFARRGIETAEEECCDSWVVGGLAASPRLYAEALLATVDFEAELRRPRLPPGACAVTRSARLLRRRLLGMIHASHPYRLRTSSAIRAVVIAALLIRPVLQAATPEQPESPATPVASEVPRPHCLPLAPRPHKVTEPRAWATATAPGGGPIVVARDHEVVLRYPDGTTRVLGPGRPLALAFAPALPPGGARLATAGPGPLVRTWDDRGDLIATARGTARAVALCYTPDGTRVLVLDAAGVVTVRDAQTLEPLASWVVEGPANSITCAPDGRTVAVSCGSWLAETGWVECWSIPERKKLASYPASAPVGATRFSPDGKMLVIGGWNGFVAWRSLPGGELLAERQLTKDLVATTAFCPDAGTLPLEPPPEPAPPPLEVDKLGVAPER